ncbi:MAG: hypothetical protein JXQ90_18090 [Cyclobacteriaceae bacterium]
MKKYAQHFLIALISVHICVSFGLAQATFVNVQAVGISPGHAVTSFSVECIVQPISSEYTLELQRFTNSNPTWVTINTQQWNEYLYTLNGYRVYAIGDNNPLTGSSGDDGINLYRFRSSHNGNVTTSYAAYGASYDYSDEIGCSKYNDVYRRAGHNSYEKVQFRTLKDALNTTQSIELDFHTDLFGSKWEVRHIGLGSGNHNNCGSGDSYFDVCLTDVYEWSNSNPNHEVITLFLDLKSDWFEPFSQGPLSLDNLLVSTFGSKLYTPQDMRDSYSSLRQSATDGRWPIMDEMKGKILCVITGKNSRLNEYVNDRGNSSKAFIAPNIEDTIEIDNISDISTANMKWVIYYNIDLDDIKNGDVESTSLFTSNFVSRVYELPDLASNFILNFNETTTDSDYILGVQNEVHFFAMHRSGQTAFNYQKMDGSYGKTAEKSLFIDGDGLVCNNASKALSLNSSISGSYNWSVNNSNLTIEDGQGTSTVTVEGKSSGNGSTTLTGTITTGLGCAYSKTKEIWVGTPNGPIVNDPYYKTFGCYNISVSSTTPNFSSDSYSWYTGGGIGIYPDYVSCKHNLPNPGVTGTSASYKFFFGTSGYVYTTASNLCGSGGTTSTYVIKTGAFAPMTMGPNPASQDLNFTFAVEEQVEPELLAVAVKEGLAAQNESHLATPLYQILIYDKHQRIVLKDEIIEGQDTSLDISKLKKGNYFVHIIYGDVVEVKQLVKQ